MITPLLLARKVLSNAVVICFLTVLDCVLFDGGLFPLVCELALPVVALRGLSNVV